MKIPAALRSGFAKALLESELSFGEEAGRLVCESDTGDAVVNELRWLGRIAPVKCDGLVAAMREF